MLVTTEIIDFPKRFIFSVRKGCLHHVRNIFIKITHLNSFGYGEAALGTASEFSPEEISTMICEFFRKHSLENVPIPDIWKLAKEQDMPAPAQAAIDMALWDLNSRMQGATCSNIFSIKRKPVFSSITVGANVENILRAQVIELLSMTKAQYLKIKLGYSEGISRDKEIFSIASDASQPFNVKFRVDANGGWNISQAIEMLDWLRQFDVEFVEQPVDPDNFIRHSAVLKNHSLPVFLDESCHFSNQIPIIANDCDGVVIKLMKCGGLTEALRMLTLARKYKLKTVLGCKSESSMGIMAALSIAPLFDFVDLDSHIYIANDPFAEQAGFIDGKISASDNLGCGAVLSATSDQYQIFSR